MNDKYNMEFNLDEIYQTRRTSKTNTANIPAYLREHGLFCLWKYETKEDGTTTKVPYNPKSPQYHAQSNDRRTFASLETAAARASGFDGLGVGIFDAVAAIDIDHCIKDGRGKTLEVADLYLLLSDPDNKEQILEIIYQALNEYFEAERYYEEYNPINRKYQMNCNKANP